MNMENPYQSLIDAVDVLLQKVEVCGPVISINYLELPFAQKTKKQYLNSTNPSKFLDDRIMADSVKETLFFLDFLKQKGIIDTWQELAWDGTLLTQERLPDEHFFLISGYNKDKLLNERERLVSAFQQLHKERGSFEGKFENEGNREQKKILRKHPSALFGKFPDIGWMGVTIAFKEIDTDVKIKVSQREYLSDYEKMGFADKRTDQSKKNKMRGSWDLLFILAMNGGVFPLDKLGTVKERKKRNKQKQSLSRRLKSLFSTDQEPFEKYNESVGYKIKLNLIFKDNDSQYGKKVYDEKDPYGDLDESYKKETPLM